MDLSTLSALLLAVSGLGLVYFLGAAGCLIGLALRRRASATVFPSITVLKPLHGDEPGLVENLAGLCRQDYPGRVEIVCGVQREGDPAIAAVRALQAQFPDRAIRLVINAALHGSNRKVSNLVNMEGAIAGDVVVFADSDIVVAPDYLSRLVAELERPGVGAVTCLYHGLPRAGRWSQLATLAIDTHFVPGVAVGLGLGLARPCFGSTIALRRETLRRIGGFRAVRDDLADDYAVGAKVRALGLAVSIPPFSVGHVFAERSGRELLAQELRWARTVRSVDPAGHIGSLVAHPLGFAALACLVDPSLTALGFCLLAILCRIGLCLAGERAFGLKPHPYRLVPLRDLLSFGILLASFAGRRVSWRGHRYDVAPSGALLPNVES